MCRHLPNHREAINLLLQQFPRSGTTKANLNHPSTVALDGAGILYVADFGNDRIRKVETNGIISTVAGSGTVGYSGDGGPATNANVFGPIGIGLDTGRNLFFSDYFNSRIRNVDTNGIITTVAGNGPGFPTRAQYSGDGGPATNAGLNHPIGLALDASGNLYIADKFNDRVREVHFAGYPALELTNVSTNKGGKYTVIVTGPYGTVTSAVATLTVNMLRTPP